jgi:hypothetical protein
MLVHADETLNKLFGIFCKVFEVFALRHVLVEIFEVETLVRRRAVGPVADAGSLEVFFGDLDLVPESVQRVDHVRSVEFHLVSNLVQEKLNYKVISRVEKLLTASLTFAAKVTK